MQSRAAYFKDFLKQLCNNILRRNFVKIIISQKDADIIKEEPTIFKIYSRKKK